MRFDPKSLGITTVGGIAFVAAAGLSVLGATWAASAIEDLSSDAVREALVAQGYTWASVEADGLNIILTGEAPSEPVRARAVNAAGTVIDINRVVDSMTVPDPAAIAAPDFKVEILRNDDGISLIGLVPMGSGRDRIVGLVQDKAKGGPVTDMLEAVDRDAPETWDAAVDFGIEALGSLPRSKMSIGPGRVEVTAITDSINEKAALERRLSGAKPRGVELVMNISAPRPVITPFTLRFLKDDNGPHFDACSADTERARDRILAAGRSAGAPEDSDCTIGMGTPSPAWAEAAEEAIKAVAELGAGSVTISDADVSLIAAETVTQADFDRVAGELDTALPEVFSLTAVLTPKPAAQAADQGPPQVTATLSEEGRVQIRGRLADDLTREAVESYAHAHFGTGNVYVATRIDSDVPPGWPVRVLAGLEALDRVHDGRLLVQPNLVRIEGRTGSRETSAQIAQLLSQRLGEGQEFDIRVAYDRKLDASLALPSAAQCVERLAGAQEAQKIGFEPGSARITSDSREIMDRIGDILRQCGDYQFEVAGHTDSQGRDAMNLALSEDRAEAVVEGLMQRRVLTANLHPMGYGKDKPIAPNNTEEGREQNRRIEFTLLEDGAAQGASAQGTVAPTVEAAAAAAAADQPADADVEIVVQTPGQATARPRFRPRSLVVPEATPEAASEVAPSADPAVVDAVDAATGMADEGSGDGPDDGSGDGSGDAYAGGSGDGEAPEGAEGEMGEEMTPEDFLRRDDQGAPQAAQGEVAPTETPAEATAEAPAATSAETAAVTPPTDAAPAADAATAEAPATAENPMASATQPPAGVAAPGSEAALPAATPPADPAATAEATAEGAPAAETAAEPEIVIEVQTPTEDTVTPPARPAAIEARAARQ